MNLRPLSNNVLIKRDKPEEKTKGGLILPDQAQTKPRRGTIVAVGPGKLNPKTGAREPIELKKGQAVLFESYGCDDLAEFGEGVVMVDASSVMAEVDE